MEERKEGMRDELVSFEETLAHRTRSTDGGRLWRAKWQYMCHILVRTNIQALASLLRSQCPN